MSVVHRIIAWAVTVSVAVGTGLAMMAPASAADSPASFLGQFSKLKNVASTVPGNGDVNPYGVAVVRASRGRLHRGDVLVSNFNNKANEQGTGTTIVEVSPGGQQTQFARITSPQLTGRCPGGIGLTTALAVLRGGWVVVGSTTSKNGSVTTAKAGCLIVLDSHGTVRGTISGKGINGPWDMAALSAGWFADLFVTNVLNGNVAGQTGVVDQGTVLRLLVHVYWNRPPKLLAVTTIGSGSSSRPTRPRSSSARPGSGWAGTARSSSPTPGRTGSPLSGTR